MPLLTAVLLDCTLTLSPAVSDNEASLGQVAHRLGDMDVASETLRVTDYAVKFGFSTDEGSGDDWPFLAAKIKAADIIVMGVPIRFGSVSSVAHMVVERLEGMSAERNHGRFPLHNKVAAVVATRGERGGQAGTVLLKLSQIGCTIPPNAVAESESAISATTSSAVHIARLLKADPIPARGDRAVEQETADPLPRKLFPDLPTSHADLDEAMLEAEKRAAEEGRLLDRRRHLDLTWREKGLPEKRKPRGPIDPHPEGTTGP